MVRGNADWIIGVPLAGLALLFFTQSLAMPNGPATFPRAISLLMVALCVALTLRNLLRERGFHGSYWSSEGPMRTGLLVSLLTVGYVLSLGRVSYLFSTLAYFAAMMWMLGLKPRWLAPAVACVSAIAFYLFFVQLMRVSLE